MRKTTIVALLFVVCALACSSSSPSTTSSPSAPASSTPAATPCSVAGASTTTTTVPSSASTAAVTDVSYTDTGCVRIVFRFGGDHTPGYTVGYANPPFADCGSGADVATSSWGADHYLQIKLEPSGGVDLSTSANPTYKGSRDIRVDRPTLKHLRVTCDFEAVFTWIAGLSGEHAFKVEALRDPPRLVIDISQS
jgi:hypothetical protein